MFLPDDIKKLFEAGLSADQLVVALEVIDQALNRQMIPSGRSADALRQARYRERKGLTSSEWEALRIEVFSRDGYICYYCGCATENPHCDHFIPLILSGTNEIDNLVTSCPKCNFSKSGKHPNEWEKISTNSLHVESTISTDVEKRNLYQRRWRDKKKAIVNNKEISTSVEIVEKNVEIVEKNVEIVDSTCREFVEKNVEIVEKNVEIVEKNVEIVEKNVEISPLIDTFLLTTNNNNKLTKMPFTEIPQQWASWTSKEYGWSSEVVTDTFQLFYEYWVNGKGKSTKREKWGATWRQWCRSQSSRIKTPTKNNTNTRYSEIKNNVRTI